MGEACKLGDGPYYVPTHREPKPNKKQIAEYDKIFEEALKAVRIKNEN